jgi:POT family proton-dependent oligopeptide transporter
MTDDAQVIAAPAAREARTFFGQPRPLAYLAFTEAWERFSYYGMTALLVLYMSHALFTPGHIEHIAGFAAFRRVITFLFGPLSTLALASQVYGLYTAGVYLTPILGGLVADLWIGRRNAVMIGAVLMSAGQISMAFDASFLMALVLLMVGCGLLKGNISTQVGALYAENDGAGRTRGFSIFSMGINVGAVLGPLLCGLLAKLYGWHAGFALGGALMLIGLATYIAGYKYLHDPVHPAHAAHATDTAGQGRVILALIAVIALTVFQSISYYQNSNIGLIWIDSHVDLNVLGFDIPVAWFNSIDSFTSIVSVPVLFALWRRQAVRGGEPGELAKIATGAAIACAANLLLVAASLAGNRTSGIVPVLYDVLLGIAFLYYWPTLLALVSRAAPHGLKSTLMGCAFLSLSVSNFTLGRIGTYYEHMTPAQFWALHAAIAATGAVLAFVLKRPLERILVAPTA